MLLKLINLFNYCKPHYHHNIHEHYHILQDLLTSHNPVKSREFSFIPPCIFSSVTMTHLITCIKYVNMVWINYISRTLVYCKFLQPLQLQFPTIKMPFIMTGRSYCWESKPLLSEPPCQIGIDWCHLLSGMAKSEYTLPSELWACYSHSLLSVYLGPLSHFTFVTHFLWEWKHATTSTPPYSPAVLCAHIDFLWDIVLCPCTSAGMLTCAM